MEKWTGIISGTNRGLVVIELDIVDENRIAGIFNLYDAENINLTGKIEGTIEGNGLEAKAFEFRPEGERVPTECKLNLTISEDGKEMRGEWETDIDTKGECILYKFSIGTKQAEYEEPTLTLEAKDVSIEFCSFDERSIKDVVNIMTDIANSIRKGKEQDILPPIYSIWYDREERVRTYSRDDFFNKFKEASNIRYIGFEFKHKGEITNIILNLVHQERYNPSLRSHILVESTDKAVVTLIPEMVRGLVSKAKNNYRFWHHWGIEASIQILVVITVFVISYIVSRKIALAFPQMSQNRIYVFIVLLIIMSNLWTYLSRLVFNLICRAFPRVEINNRPKSKFFPVLVVAIFVSVFASAIIYCVTLLLKFLL
ncbi:hypothetical protein ACFL5Z_04470 [Planctomycetota bacterium]